MHAIVVAGAAAGALDILAAFTLSAYYGGTPVRVLQGIASSVMGPAAFQGGMSTAALGLGLHFVIAFGAASVYYGLAKIAPVLTRRAIPSGVAFGVAVYLFMNLVVLPLSRVTPRPPRTSTMIALVIIHIFCVGLPIASSVRRGMRRAAPASAAV